MSGKGKSRKKIPTKAAPASARIGVDLRARRPMRRKRVDDDGENGRLEAEEQALHQPDMAEGGVDEAQGP